MKLLTTTISFVLVAGTIISPVLLIYGLNKRNIKYNFLLYLALSTIITATTTLTFAWWADTSNQILLSHYGYDFDAMNDTKRFANVSAENMKGVKSLEISMMGIGWPTKAMTTYLAYSPYLLIICIAVYLPRRKKKERTPNNVQGT